MRVLDASSWAAVRKRLADAGGPPALPEPDLAAWHNQVATDSERSEYWYSAVHHLNALLRDSPNDLRFVVRRARAHARLRRYGEASTDFDKAIRLGTTDTEAWYVSALARLGRGDINGYRARCDDMLRRFGATEDADEASMTARVCCLASGSVADFKTVVQLAERFGVAKESENALKDPGITFRPADRFKVLLGITLVRAGRFKDALEPLKQAVAKNGEAASVTELLYLALAYHGLKNADEAGRHLQKALEVLDSGAQLSWHDEPFVQVLRKEVEHAVGAVPSNAGRGKQ
jgi:tetratricopeptide (TPR) repeat protein